MSSKPVESPQRGPHPRLVEVVRRHLAARSHAPIPPHTREAFDRVADRIMGDPQRPIVLDSGCGTGASALALARAHADAWVVGLDRSAARLARGPLGQYASLPPNLVLARAELAAFWRLAREAGWRLARHVLLHPNPWPKPRHLGRRWHAHPGFPDLLALGGTLVLRTNWVVYAEEFSIALAEAGIAARVARVAVGEAPWSPFEAKYAASGHAIYALEADLDRGR